MKKCINIGLLLLVAAQSSQSQSNVEQYASNEMKYWKLRGRLIGDENNRDVYNGFVVVGANKGMSIPAEERNLFKNKISL